MVNLLWCHNFLKHLNGNCKQYQRSVIVDKVVKASDLEYIDDVILVTKSWNYLECYLIKLLDIEK